MGVCGLHALVDPIARSKPFSMLGHKFGHRFGHKFGHKFGRNFGRNFGQTRKGKELLEPSNRALVLPESRNGALEPLEVWYTSGELLHT